MGREKIGKTHVCERLDVSLFIWQSERYGDWWIMASGGYHDHPITYCPACGEQLDHIADRCRACRGERTIMVGGFTGPTGDDPLDEVPCPTCAKYTTNDISDDEIPFS